MENEENIFVNKECINMFYLVNVRCEYIINVFCAQIYEYEYQS